ncbi:MAG: low molecular weight protein arginine phosphatase [Gemmatimonadetes bacterium]|nr:low molecular weight protein arginine phosphatase [Gemmatimonadota bacterium]
MLNKHGEPFRILFVCTGNTCRSPLAESLARRAVDRFGWGHVEVRSAGVAAVDGTPASPGSIRVAARHGLDLSVHRGSRLTGDLVEWADLVLIMSPRQMPYAETAGGAGKVSLITDFSEGRESTEDSMLGGVFDPMGGDDEEYEQTYLQLAELIERVLARLEPLVAP